MNILSWFKAKKTSEAPRAPRVVLLPFFPLHFNTGDGRDLLVANISTSGVGFDGSSFASVPIKGQRIHGTLRLEEKSYSLSMQVVHSSASVVGCIIHPQNSEFSRDLNTYLEVELSAVVTRQIDPKILKESPQGKPHWYVGRQNACELFFTEKDGVLLDFHCTIWGHYFESKKPGHLRFGVVSKPSPAGSPGSSSNLHPQANLIEDVADPSPSIDALALRFVTNIPKIENQFRDQILERLRR